MHKFYLVAASLHQTWLIKTYTLHPLKYFTMGEEESITITAIEQVEIGSNGLVQQYQHRLTN
jgi:hypothetical protein